MTNILEALLAAADQPDDGNAALSDPATLLAQADKQLTTLEQVFRARGDDTYVGRIAELKQILKRLRRSTRTPAQ